MKKQKKISSTDFFGGSPETTEEMTNKYGTYNIQPTADSDSKFPHIAQGYPKSKKEK